MLRKKSKKLSTLVNRYKAPRAAKPHCRLCGTAPRVSLIASIVANIVSLAPRLFVRTRMQKCKVVGRRKLLFDALAIT